ncbi:MAG TPA: class I SAM-dependent methyltransferase [Gemmatimonadales bacterium]|nr:class I SAM-dependent methyltransferase [Gemmatimonadales bacterium]
MRASTLYDLLAPAYGRVLGPVLESANQRAAERVLGGAPGSVLEIGVGPGQALTELATRARRVVGLDVSGAMLRRAAARIAGDQRRAALVRGDGLSLPFASETFEAVMSTFLLDLLPDDQQRPMVGELARVLAPGGRAVLGMLELPNPLLSRAWMAVYRIAPDALGGVRPVDLSTSLAGQHLRVARDERLDGWLTTRILTLVKVGGPGSA